MATNPNILFHWKAPASDFAQRMIIAAVAAISIHGLCFYVFQVQDPESPRTLPRTYGVTYLSPQDPTAHLILQQIDDYYAAYEGTLLADSELNMPLGSLDYEPSYTQMSPRLMPWPERNVLPLEALGPRDNPIVLPEIPPWTPPEKASGSANASPEGFALVDGLRLFLPDGWRARYLGGGLGTDWSAVEKRRPADRASQGWRLSVSRDGRVAKAVPSEAAAPADRTAEEALKTLRFTPWDDGEDIDSFEIELRWRPPQP